MMNCSLGTLLQVHHPYHSNYHVLHHHQPHQQYRHTSMATTTTAGLSATSPSSSELSSTSSSSDMCGEAADGDMGSADGVIRNDRLVWLVSAQIQSLGSFRRTYNGQFLKLVCFSSARLLTDGSPQPHIVTLQPADTVMHAVGAAAALAAAADEATAAAVGPVKVGFAKCTKHIYLLSTASKLW